MGKDTEVEASTNLSKEALATLEEAGVVRELRNLSFCCAVETMKSRRRVRACTWHPRARSESEDCGGQEEREAARPLH